MRNEVKGMWRWLEKNHPIIYEMVQWSILGLAIAALINAFV